MKIEGTNVGGISPDSPVQKPGVAAGSEAARRAARIGYDASSVEGPEAESSEPDQVQLSGLGRELARLAKADPEREGRIDKLAADYEAGRLKIDSAEVAKKLVEDAFSSD